MAEEAAGRSPLQWRGGWFSNFNAQESAVELIENAGSWAYPTPDILMQWFGGGTQESAFVTVLLPLPQFLCKWQETVGVR